MSCVCAAPGGGGATGSPETLTGDAVTATPPV
jgi:hypothetical protein